MVPVKGQVCSSDLLGLGSSKSDLLLPWIYKPFLVTLARPRCSPARPSALARVAGAPDRESALIAFRGHAARRGHGHPVLGVESWDDMACRHPQNFLRLPTKPSMSAATSYKVAACDSPSATSNSPRALDPPCDTGMYPCNLVSLYPSNAECVPLIRRHP